MSHPALRLITKEGFDALAREVVPEARTTHAPLNDQLCFSFDDEVSHDRHLVEIVSMDGLHGKHLCQLILAKRPKVVLDLRHVMRFDLPGTSREQVLSHFRAISTLYVREPLPWHELQRRDFISGNRTLSQRLEHETVERKQSPIMLFVPKDEHISLVSAYLNRVFSTRGQGRWQISTVH